MQWGDVWLDVSGVNENVKFCRWVASRRVGTAQAQAGWGLGRFLFEGIVDG